MKEISIWLLPSDIDYKRLTNVIQGLSTTHSAPLFIPHLTIFGDIKTNPSVIISVVKEIIGDISTIKLPITSIKESDNFFKTVFLEFKANENLMILHNELQGKLGKFTDFGNKPFQPHLSLIYKELNKEKRLKIINTLKIGKYINFDKIMLVSPANLKGGWRDLNSWEILHRQSI